MRRWNLCARNYGAQCFVQCTLCTQQMLKPLTALSISWLLMEPFEDILHFENLRWNELLWLISNPQWIEIDYVKQASRAFSKSLRLVVCYPGIPLLACQRGLSIRVSSWVKNAVLTMCWTCKPLQHSESVGQNFRHAQLCCLSHEASSMCVL